MTSPTPRRPSPAVYRRRRLAVLLVLLLVVGSGVALAVWQPWRAAGDGVAAPSGTPAPGPGTGGVDESPSPGVSPGPGDSPEPGASPEPSDSPEPSVSVPAPAPTSPTPSGSATGVAVCSSGDVTVTASTDKTSYGAGELPQLSITLVNDGDEACAMNVGTAAQAFIIESGPDVWWRSTDCQSESTDQLVQVDAGQSVSSVTPLVWDRTRSSVDTCDRDRAEARAGYYNLTVVIGGIDSEPSQFRLR